MLQACECVPFADGVATVFGHVVTGHQHRLGTQVFLKSPQCRAQIVELACPLATSGRQQAISQIQTGKALNGADARTNSSPNAP